jgi:YD repeat-containing protein
MKPFYLTTIIATILFICNNGIQAQTKPTSTANINQFEMIKQLHNNLPPEIKQPFNENKHQMPQGFENLQNPEILKPQKVNQVKSATAENLKLDSMITENLNGNQWRDLPYLYFYSKNTKIYSLHGYRTPNEFYTRQLFNYDDNSILIGSTYYGWGYNSDGNYYLQFKTESVYDTNGNVTLLNSYTESRWRPGKYVFQGREEYYYDENCKKKLDFPYHFNFDEFNYSAFDANGNLTLFINSKGKTETEYDSNGNKILEIFYNCNSLHGECTESEAIEYYYDSNSNLILQNDYSSVESWWHRSPDKTTKYNYTYDANGMMTSQSLDLDWKYDYTWDTYGNMTTRNYYTWDESKSTWNLQDTLLWKYTYDSIGNMTSQSLIGKWKYEYTYDGDGNKIQELFFLWDNRIADTRTTWYYSDRTATSILNTTTPNLTVYPNPAKDFVVFNLPNGSESATIELYDIQGKKVIQQKLTETRQLAVGQLPKGLYLYRLTDSETFYSGKLVVE